MTVLTWGRYLFPCFASKYIRYNRFFSSFLRFLLPKQSIGPSPC
ncbi:uncharacterized protein J3R85_004222 [Psidium guajava]|nr:uncharacterized protein J3R85_004222 [Psidium guajava]